MQSHKYFFHNETTNLLLYEELVQLWSCFSEELSTCTRKIPVLKKLLQKSNARTVQYTMKGKTAVDFMGFRQCQY